MGKKAVVAGHICIDITPGIPIQSSDKIQDIFVPGNLITVGNADIHTGGAVANTGLAMKIFGADVSLVGKIGNDVFGDMVLSITDRYDASEGLIRKDEDLTSYSVVLAVPEIDRIFLHCPGANNTFCADDIPIDVIKEAALFHFGYPPLMKRIYENEGAELVKIMQMAKTFGSATSLDLCAVDSDTEAGSVDWKLVLSRVLPYVDFFVPSIEELLFMLDRSKYERLRNNNQDADLTKVVDLKEDIEPLGQMCLDMGARVVLIKCGAPGMYYCTKDAASIAMISDQLSLVPTEWADRKDFKKSYKPEKVLSGTGAGDTSVAAFLTSVLEGYSLEKSIRYALAAGTCCVEAYDALSGLKSFEELDRKYGL